MSIRCEPFEVEAEPDDVADELFRLDAGEGRVEVVGVADVDRIDARHARVHDERIELLAAAAVGAHLFQTFHNRIQHPIGVA